MRTIFVSHVLRAAILLAAIVCWMWAGSSVARAEHCAGWAPASYTPLPAPRAPEPDVRAGGVIDVSYNYHTQGPNAGVTPPSPWYGWGFPVQTYRWGWFGAAHYYPWCYWHEGYYGDCCRYAYRCGY